jgi:hypothetical protein
MRKLRFRAWENVGKCMLDWSCIVQTAFNRTTSEYDYGLMYRILTNQAAGNDNYGFVVMPFTGFEDRNKIELYEGDIISNAPRNNHLETDMWYEIYWNGRWSGRLVCHHSVCGGGYIDDLSKVDFRFFERIGNIYENTQLLKS